MLKNIYGKVLYLEENGDYACQVAEALKEFEGPDLVEITDRIQQAIDRVTGVSDALPQRDEQMPGAILVSSSGLGLGRLSLLKQLRNHARTRFIPIVLMISATDCEQLALFYREGVNSCIVKPADAKEMAHILHKLSLYWLLFNQLPMMNG